MSTIAQRFQLALQQTGVLPQSRVLLAFSGGLDSTVLFHLLKDANVSFAVAHVNYGLRGASSNSDEAFCHGLAQENGVPFYAHLAKAEMEQRPGGVSVQELAREIRYRFFTQLCEEHGFTHVLTAHHANDSVETFFVNLLRGTGIQGLGGIPAENGRILRPLLNFTSEELENLAAENRWEYRTDASNEKDDYLRNRLRHHVLPALQQAEPEYLERLTRSMTNLSNEAQLLDALLNLHFTEPIERTAKASVTVFAPALRATVLFKRFGPLGLTYSQAQDMAAALEGIPGKLFLTPTHRLLLDREYILAESTAAASASVVAGAETVWLKEGDMLPGYRVSILPAQGFVIPQTTEAAFLDADKLQFPLLWRPIKTGDSMQPLGMAGHKKVSDLLSNAKMDRFAKGKLHVLCSGDEIVWLEGIRIADSSKISPQTGRILCIIPENW